MQISVRSLAGAELLAARAASQHVVLLPGEPSNLAARGGDRVGPWGNQVVQRHGWLFFFEGTLVGLIVKEGQNKITPIYFKTHPIIIPCLFDGFSKHSQHIKGSKPFSTRVGEELGLSVKLPTKNRKSGSECGLISVPGD